MTAQKVYSTLDMQNAAGIINVPNGVAAQDVAAFGQVQAAQSAAQAYTDSQLAAVVSGQTLKGAVRAVVSTNVTIATPGTTLDGLTAANGDIFLLTGQTTGSQNGPYVFNGSAAAMTRATNWDTAGEAVVGSYWVVREGTQADKFALLTNDTFVLNTTTGTFAYIGSVAGGGFTSASGTLGAAAAGGTATFTHNLNTQKIGYSIRLTLTPFNFITGQIEARATTVNTLDFLPDVAISASQYTVMVWAVP